MTIISSCFVFYSFFIHSYKRCSQMMKKKTKFPFNCSTTIFIKDHSSSSMVCVCGILLNFYFLVFRIQWARGKISIQKKGRKKALAFIIIIIHINHPKTNIEPFPILVHFQKETFKCNVRMQAMCVCVCVFVVPLLLLHHLCVYKATK